MATTSSRSNGKRDTRTPGTQSAAGQWLMGLLIVLALVASVMMVWSDQLSIRASVAVIAALWAAVLGAIGVTRFRRQAEVAEAKSRDMRLVYELQLEREISARRQYEMDVEAHIRREVADEAGNDLRELQAQIAALRVRLEEMMGHELPDERVALANEQLRELSAAVSPSYGGEDSLRAASDFASTAPPAADGRHVPQGGRNDLTEIIPVVEDEHEPYANPFDQPSYTVPVDDSPSWTGTQAYSAGAYANETTVVVADEGVEVSEAEAARYTEYTSQSYGEQTYGDQTYSTQAYGEQTYGEQEYGEQTYGEQTYTAQSSEYATAEQQYPTDAWVTPSAQNAEPAAGPETGGRRRVEGQHESGISAADLLSQLRNSQSGGETHHRRD